MTAKARMLSPADADFVVQGDDGKTYVIQAKVARKRARVKVGGVMVTGDKATVAEVKRSVARSSDMLERLGKKIAKPGVRLYASKGVPLFSADPDQPGRVVRKLGGKTERGVLENGVFKAIK